MKRFFVIMMTLGIIFQGILHASEETDSQKKANIHFEFKLSSIRHMLDNNKHMNALEELREMTGEYSGHPEVLFLLGTTAVHLSVALESNEQEKEGLLSEAIDAFLAILFQHPDLMQVHLELGWAFFLKGEDNEARNHLDIALKSNLSADVLADVENILRTMDTRRPIDAVISEHDIERNSEEILEQESIEVQMAAIGKFLNNGQNMKVLEILQETARENPRNLDILFLLGVTAVNIVQNVQLDKKERELFLNEAIEAFSAMLEQKPNLVRVNLELGRAFFLKEDDANAKKYFEIALNMNPPEEVVENVLDFMSIMNDRKPWQARITLSMIYDTNINRDSEKKIIYIYNLPFELEEKNKKTASLGVDMNFEGDYRIPLSERQLFLEAGGGINRRAYKERIHDDMTTLSTHLGLSSNEGNSSVGTKIYTHQQFNGNQPSSGDTGILMNINHQFDSRTNVRLETSRYAKTHQKNKEMDGPGGSIRARISHQIIDKIQIDASIAHEYDLPRLDTNWHQRRNSVELGMTASLLPFDIMMRTDMNLKWVQYKGNWYPYTTDGSPREDMVSHIHLSIWHPQFTLFDFVPRLSLGFERRTTNAQLYDYERAYGEIFFSRQL